MPEAYEILRFIIQLSAALAGACSFWGAILFWRASRAEGEKKEGFLNLAYLLSFLFLSALVIFFTSWWFSALTFFSPESLAHEGIVIKSEFFGIQKGFSLNLWPVSILLLVSLIFFVLFSVFKDLFRKYGGWLFLIQFLLLSFILSFTVWTGSFDKNQFFYDLHNWHSVLTLGTVILVDFIYIATLRRDDLKKVLYPFFPFLSIAIWLGLGLDFLSVALIFEEAFKVTTQFLFNQTVVSIIIINGALLSGKINEILIGLVSPESSGEMSQKVSLIFGISGSISIVSWLTITTLDFFKFGFSYLNFSALYLALIIIAFFSQYFIKKLILSYKKESQLVDLQT